MTLCTQTTYIKLVAKKKKKGIGNSDTNNKNIQPRYRNKIWHQKMCHAHNEKWKKRNDGRN